MSLLIGETAPNFQIDSQKGKIDLHDFIGNSLVFFFSHPADFTPVCTTEMGRTAQLAEEFKKRNVKPLGLSTDSVQEHNEWIKDVNETQKTDLPIFISCTVSQAVPPQRLSKYTIFK